MLAFMHPPTTSPPAYPPPHASPLSPRSANIPTRWPRDSDPMSHHPPQHQDRPARQDENAPPPFSKRPAQRAPLPTHDELQERRRAKFLRNVKGRREDRRFEARGEDLMRLEFVRQRRAFEAELARSAPCGGVEGVGEEEVEEEEEEGLPMWSQRGSRMRMGSQRRRRRLEEEEEEEEEVEEFVRGEEGELEALLEFMMEERGRVGEGGMEEVEEELWSDDADYDALFEEVLGLEEGTQTRRGGEVVEMSASSFEPYRQQSGNDDEMDVS